MNSIYNELLKQTNFFFDNILTSEEMQEDYELLRNDNGKTALSIIKKFKEENGFYIIKPFYELDYANASVPRVLKLMKDKNGLIICSLLNDINYPPYPIEPRFLVSIILQHIEDEEIKKNLHNYKVKEEKQTEKETEL